jgi:hypothetical protein
MKKLTTITLTILIALFLSSCGNAELTLEEMNNLVVEYNGGDAPFAGVNIGDDWNEIKKNYSTDWVVSEDGTNGSLKKEWDFYNSIFISIYLDENKKVKSMSMNFETSLENTVHLIEVSRALDNKFDKKYKVNGEESWELGTHENYFINKSYSDKLGKDKNNSSLRIRVEEY